MLTNSQRYQKTRNVSGMLRSHRLRAGLWLALSVGLVGCAGAERPANPVGADLRQSLAPLDTAGAMQVAALAGATPAPPQSPSGTITLVTPPQSRQAVVRAREAMQKKQWAMLETLVPIAKSDPVLGTYAEYWMLRQKLQDSTQPVPDQEMQRFMQ